MPSTLLGGMGDTWKQTAALAQGTDNVVGEERRKGQGAKSIASAKACSRERIGNIWQAGLEGIAEGLSHDRAEISTGSGNEVGAGDFDGKSWKGRGPGVGLA